MEREIWEGLLSQARGDRVHWAPSSASGTMICSCGRQMEVPTRLAEDEKRVHVRRRCTSEPSRQTIMVRVQSAGLRTVPSHATMLYGPCRNLLPPRCFAVEYQKPADYDTG